MPDLHALSTSASLDRVLLMLDESRAQALPSRFLTLLLACMGFLVIFMQLSALYHIPWIVRFLLLLGFKGAQDTDWDHKNVGCIHMGDCFMSSMLSGIRLHTRY